MTMTHADMTTAAGLDPGTEPAAGPPAGRPKRRTFSAEFKAKIVAEYEVIYMSPTWGQLTYRFAESEGGWGKLAVTPASSRIAAVGSRLADGSQPGRWPLFHALRQFGTRDRVQSLPSSPDQ